MCQNGINPKIKVSFYVIYVVKNFVPGVILSILPKYLPSAVALLLKSRVSVSQV